MNRSLVPRRVFGFAMLSSMLGMVAADLETQDGGTDVNRGRAVHKRHCLACHGVIDLGDGPEAGLVGDEAGECSSRRLDAEI